MVFESVSINYVAVLVSTIACFMIGYLWYGPLFGKAWAKEMNVKNDPSKMKGMWKLMLINFVGTFMMVYAIAHFVDFLKLSNYIEALQLGFWVWLGFFAATTLLGGVLWEGKSWKLYSINALYWLVNLCVPAVILTIWK